LGICVPCLCPFSLFPNLLVCKYKTGLNYCYKFRPGRVRVASHKSRPTIVLPVLACELAELGAYASLVAVPDRLAVDARRVDERLPVLQSDAVHQVAVRCGSVLRFVVGSFDAERNPTASDKTDNQRDAEHCASSSSDCEREIVGATEVTP
jgi:hypothetical protein